MPNVLYELIYNYSPLSLQNIIVSKYGEKLVKERYGAYYWNERGRLLSKNYSNLEAELKIQSKEFIKLVVYAYHNSRFYKNLYQDVDINNINGLNDLHNLPIVDKETLRANINNVYTISESDGLSLFTGGTTGKSLKVLYRIEDFQKRMAYLDAFKIRTGTDPFSSRKATFSGRSVVKGLFQQNRKIFWRNNKHLNQRLYSTFHMTDANLPYYVDDLNNFQPEVLNGFVSALDQLASYIATSGGILNFIPKAIYTTSETLLPHQRENIQKVFKTKIYNQYGSAEGATFITECTEGNLHYNIDTGILETTDIGEGPETLVTSFTTYGTPLIRYRIGDVITFKEGSCACGSCHPLVERIEGRKVEYLYSPATGLVSLSHLADVIKGLPNCVKRMQFIQHEINYIQVLLCVDLSSYNESSNQKILKELKYRFGGAMQFKIQLVESIKPESSGKVPLVKNYITFEKVMKPSIN